MRRIYLVFSAIAILLYMLSFFLPEVSEDIRTRLLIIAAWFHIVTLIDKE